MLRAKLNELLGIDVRSLAVLRIGLGSLVLADACIRFTEIGAMYADDSLMSIAASRLIVPSPWCWSLHNLNGSAEYQGALIGLAAVAAVALILGWRTWWATLVCWTLLASVHVRAPWVPNGGDLLLRVMLFWSLFVPLGRVWSLDALRRRVRPPAGRTDAGSVGHDSPAWERVASPGTAALMVQLVLMYFFTALFKMNDDWFSGQGLWYALSLDCYLRPLGQFLLGFPELLKALSWLTLALELAVPMLVWFPWHTSRLRLAAIVAFVGLHVGIHLCLTVGLFSCVSIVAWMVFLPSEFWESRPLRWLGAKLAPLARAARRRPHTGPLALPEAPRHWKWGGRLVQGTCAALVAYTVGANIASLFPGSDQAIPESVLRIGHATSILQRWDMFGKVPRNDGWYTARARLRDGSLVDVLRGGAAYDENKPQLASSIFPNQHWRYFFQALIQPKRESFRQPVAEYLFREWNRRHGPDRQIAVLELIYFHEDTDEHRQSGEFVSEHLARVKREDAAGGNFQEALEALRSGKDWP